MITKMIALGFWGAPNTYVRDAWNKLDLLVVFVGWVTVVLDSIDPELLPINLGVLRAFRVLRPLRSISRLPGLRRVISSLVNSAQGLLDLIILVTFALLIFSILGMQLFQGKMHSRCRLTPFPVRLDPTCTSNATNNFRNLDCWSAYIDTVTRDPELWRCVDPSGNPITTLDDDIKDKSSSPWATPTECIWPEDEDDTTLCADEGSMQKHTCAVDSNKNMTCGSNFDPYGNPRFVDELFPYGFKRMKSGTWSEDVNWGITQFDNIGQAFVTIFQAVSEEGWTDIMYACMDVDGTVSSLIVFVLLIFCGSFFLMNLFLAAIGIEEEEEEEEGGGDGGEGGGGENEEGEKEGTTPKIKEMGALEGFVEHKYFGHFITACILINTITLSMDTFPEPENMKDVEVVNMILTYVFIAEMALKIPALGPSKYASDPFNLFDAFIVTVSIVEIVMAAGSDDEDSGPSGMSALRTFRLFRIFKLAKNWHDMQILLCAMVRTVFDIANFAVLLGLFIYIMALVGMQFFANEMHFDPDTGEKLAFDNAAFNTQDVMENIPRNHFDNLMWSLTTIFQFLSGENWNSIMYDCFRAIGWGGVIYNFVIFVIGAMIVMNLFLAILLANFEGNDDLIKVDASADLKKKQKYDEYDVINPNTKALCCLDFENPIRSVCTILSENIYFDNIIIFLILFSSCTLALDNPLDQPSSILQTLDVILTVIFGIEALMKIIALGFWWHKGSYLRDGWNVLDFFIVVISFLALANVGPGKALRAMRTVRVLRPLRMVNRMPELQLVVNALMNSVPAVGNVLLICFLFFLIFAILGVNLFKGKLYACGGDASYDDDACPLSDGLCELVLNPVPWNTMDISLFDSDSACYTEIQGGSTLVPTSKAICDCGDPAAWAKVLPRSFDDVGDALFLLYELSTTEGWVDYMYATIDSEGVDMQPRRYGLDANGNVSFESKAGTGMIILFYVMFIVVGAFFVINLFVGVVIDNFNSLKEANDGQALFMTEEQKEWSNTQKLIMKLKPKVKYDPPTSPMRKTAHDILNVTNPCSFDAFIMGCILANSAIMAMEYHGMSDGYRATLFWINVVFAIIFTIELVVKVMALGWRRYIMDSWNKFDCIIVFGTNVGLLLFFAAGIEVGSIASVVRMCRIGRIFRLINSAKSLNHYFTTIMVSLPSLYNIGLLLFLLFFIYAVMAVQIFSKVAFGDDYNNRANFRNFGNSFVTLFRFSTGENWNGFMHSMTSNTECHDDPPFPVNSNWCFNDPDLAPCDVLIDPLNMTDAELEQLGDASCCIPLYGCASDGWAMFFFYSFTLLVTFVMLNLFLGVILEAFEDNEVGDSLSPGELDLFCEDWCQFDKDGTGFIKVKDLLGFYQILDKPMGFGEDYEASQDELYMRLDECGIMKIAVEQTDEPIISIHDVASALAKRVVAEKTGTAKLEIGEETNARDADYARYAHKVTVREVLKPKFSMTASTREINAKARMADFAGEHEEEKEEVKEEGGEEKVKKEEMVKEEMIKEEVKEELKEEVKGGVKEEEVKEENDTEGGEDAAKD